MRGFIDDIITCIRRFEKMLEQIDGNAKLIDFNGGRYPELQHPWLDYDAEKRRVFSQIFGGPITDTELKIAKDPKRKIMERMNMMKEMVGWRKGDSRFQGLRKMTPFYKRNKGKKQKTKTPEEMFEQETGKHAIWRGKQTKQFLDWKKGKGL